MIITDKNFAVEQILNQQIVAIFQNSSEYGPRGLGNRSLLFDPRNKNGKDIVNKIKKREWFRPFAGTVLLEHARDWFDMGTIKESPYMSYAIPVKEEKKRLKETTTGRSAMKMGTMQSMHCRSRWDRCWSARVVGSQNPICRWKAPLRAKTWKDRRLNTGESVKVKRLRRLDLWRGRLGPSGVRRLPAKQEERLLLGDITSG